MENSDRIPTRLLEQLLKGFAIVHFSWPLRALSGSLDLVLDQRVGLSPIHNTGMVHKHETNLEGLEYQQNENCRAASVAST